MNQLNEAIAKIGVVPVIKLNNPERDAAPLAKALCEGGLPVAEVTFRAAGADKAIKLMKEACPEMIVGAGTVLTIEQAQKAADAGAQFIVSPGFSKDLADKCVDLGIQYFPGVTTPTEYQMALPYGYEVIKFFPAEQRSGKDQGYECTVPDVQSYADRRNLPEESGRISELPGHRCMRRFLHGQG